MIRRKSETRHLDRRGFAFEDRHLLVTPRVADWPKYPKRVKKDEKAAQRQFHMDYGGRHCWLCGYMNQNGPTRLELHHLAAGSRGRSHERELFTYLCRQCHEAVSPDDLGKLLWAKWKHDRAWTDWELLTIRHGFHLPDLEVPEWCEESV